MARKKKDESTTIIIRTSPNSIKKKGNIYWWSEDGRYIVESWTGSSPKRYEYDSMEQLNHDLQSIK